MTLFIHIGYPKTATIWLQKVVLPLNPQVAFWHVRTPRHAWLEEIVTAHDFAFDALSLRSSFAEHRADVTAKAIGISWESFSGDVFAGGHNSRRNAVRLHAVFPDAKIVVFIPNQFDMIDSLYRQYVQEGGGCSLPGFLALQFPSRVSFSLDHLCYDKLIKCYQDLFGPEKAYVGLYEQLRSSPQSTMDDLYEFIGVTSFSYDQDILQTRLNPGLSFISLHIARCANHFVGSWVNAAPIVPLVRARHVRRVLQQVLDPWLFTRISPRLGFLGRDLWASIQEHFVESNRTLVREYGLPLYDYGYPLGGESNGG